MQAWEKWNQEFDDRIPIYQQIMDRFSRSYVKGEIGAGDRIPSIRDMALILRVNANTVQRVYQELERMELIYSRRGCGYFMTEREEKAMEIRKNMAGDSINRFLEEMRQLGYSDDQIVEELLNKRKGEQQNGAID